MEKCADQSTQAAYFSGHICHKNLTKTGGAY